MTTYTIQNHDPSGETYAIRWNGDIITGLCGPLYYLHADSIISCAEMLADLEYGECDPADITWATETSWHAPRATHNA